MLFLKHTYISRVPHKNPSETPQQPAANPWPSTEDSTGSQERWCLRCHHEVGRGEFDYRDTWPPKRKQAKNGSKVIQYYNVLYIYYMCTVFIWKIRKHKQFVTHDVYGDHVWTNDPSCRNEMSTGVAKAFWVGSQFTPGLWANNYILRRKATLFPEVASL